MLQGVELVSGSDGDNARGCEFSDEFRNGKGERGMLGVLSTPERRARKIGRRGRCHEGRRTGNQSPGGEENRGDSTACQLDARQAERAAGAYAPSLLKGLEGEYLNAGGYWRYGRGR